MSSDMREAVNGGTPSDLDLSGIEGYLTSLPGLLSDGTGGGEYGQHLSESYGSQSRKTKHEAASAISMIDKSFFSLAAEFILNPPPSVDAEAMVDDLVKQRLAGRSDRPTMAAHIHNAVMFLVEEIQVTDQTANLVVEHLDQQISGRPRAQYQLLQHLTHSGPSSEDTQGFKQDEVLINLTTFAALKPGCKNIVLPIRQNLQDGTYDGFIANEILHEAFEDAADPKRERDNNELLTLVALIKQAAQLDDEAAIGQLSGDLMGLWPTNCARLLADRRSHYGQKLSANFERHRQQLVALNLISSHEATDTLDISLERFLATIPKPQGRRPTAQDLVKNATLKRRVLRGRARIFGQAALSPAVEATAEEADRGPRNKIMQMDAQGQEIPSDSPEFAEFVDDYVQKYKGTPGLAENIQAMIDYLAGADFSQGRVPGIKKYNNQIKRRGASYNLYAFKPGGASGVRVSSEPARKTRILFVMPADEQTADSNKLSLLAIVRRDDVPKYEKGQGINSSASASR